MVETSTQLGDIKPQRLFTWVVQLNHIKADSFEKNLRNLISRDGDFFVDPHSNRLVLTDYISNLYKIKALIDIVDVKAK
jgi:type II secretory pathway component GspD/PulD (secretin)